MIPLAERIRRTADQIAETPAPRTRRTITADLRALGVAEGDVLLVHSSLSSLGWVAGSAMTVIQALFDAVGADGTLAMPAHSSTWTDPANWQNPPVPADWVPKLRDEWPAFDPALTPAHRIGILAEAFRVLPGTRRSYHPCHSMTANGAAAERIVANHDLSASFGDDTPLGEMVALDARVLLLGVGHSSNTSLHLAEHRAAGRPLKREGAAMIVNGERRWVEYDTPDYDCERFADIGAAFEADRPGDVRFGKVGSATARLMSMRALVAYAEEWFREHASDGDPTP